MKNGSVVYSWILRVYSESIGCIGSRIGLSSGEVLLDPLVTEPTEGATFCDAARLHGKMLMISAASTLF